MRHQCGAPRRNGRGECGIWLVNYDHCHWHRGTATFSSQGRSPATAAPVIRTGVADFWAGVITTGLAAEIGDLVADYLGRRYKSQICKHVKKAGNCQPLADAARAILELKDQAHETAGRALGALLPPNTPPFARTVVTKIGERVPLPGDTGVDNIVRAIQVVGIFACWSLGISPCPCLNMLTLSVAQDVASDAIAGLVSKARADLDQAPEEPGRTR
jgi:hypothetical protein